MSHKIFRLFLSLIILVGLVAVQAPPAARAAGPWYVSNAGDDNNNCLSASSACATINGALAKPDFVAGDMIRVAIGTYTGTGNEVVLLDNSATLAGGWDASFTTQSGMSTIDGEGVRRGVTVDFGFVTIERFVMQNGFGFSGGGIFTSTNGNLTLNDSTLSNNNAGNGGGLIVVGPTVLNNSTIIGNEASSSGGGIWNLNGTLIVNNSTISGNTTSGGGGGIKDDGFMTVLNNSTVSGNTALGTGGGINPGSNTLLVNSSTISSNTAIDGGGGLSSGGIVILQNSIVAGNSSAGVGPDCNGAIGSSGYNLIGNTSDCTFTPTTGDLTDLDPNLGLLIRPLGFPAYHPLLSGSPAIDAGNPAGCTDQAGNLLTSDQRGVARVGTCDIGAYEYTIPGPAVTVSVAGGDKQLTGTSSAFPDLIRAAALDSQGSPVSGVPIDFVAPANGPSGAFADTGTNSTSAITDEGGVATASVFTANDQAGAYVVTATAAGLGSVEFDLEQVDRPANDNLANAKVIPSLPFSDSLDNTNATLEPNEQNFCGSSPQTNSVWYSFTPTSTVQVNADMAGSSFGDTGLSLYSGSEPSFSSLNFMGASCSANPLIFTAEAGQTYYLQAQSIRSGVGDLHLNVREILPPDNDQFADAELITSLTTSRTVDLTGATSETNEPQACISMGRTAWYRLQPQTTTNVRFDTGGGISANLNIFRATGNGITDLQFLTCTIFFGAPTLQLEAGQTYYLQVGEPFGQPGSAQINLSEVTSIRGRITDEETGLALPGNQPPFAVATLQRICGEGCIENISSQNVDGDGRFTFDNYFGNPLPPGTYQIEAFASLYEHTIFGPFEFTGADLDVGDLAIAPTPTIGSISGRLLDAATSQPVSPTFTPILSLFRCDTSGCLFVNGVTPDAKGRFRFETDQFGNPLPAGNYQVSANADQYHQQDVPLFPVGGDEHRSLGNIRIQSFPVRVSDLVLCPTIPSGGGTCEFSVRLTNGTSSRLRGAAWSFVEGGLPDTLVGFTSFQPQDASSIDLNRGSSQVFHFEFTAQPSNNNLGQTMLCARLFAGIGDDPLFNTVAMRDLFCVIREAQGFAFVSPEDVMANTNAEAVTTATGSDVEPNNSCPAAQEMGAVNETFVVDGNLDSSVTPDVDFFRFSGTPGQAVSLDLQGQSTGHGTLTDPFLGFFDSNCNLITWNDDSGSLNSHLEVTIPNDGIFILGATACCDIGFNGGGNGTYQLTITPVQSIGSISGQVTDAVTRKGLRGDIAPFAFVRLLQCGIFGCFDVNGQNADSRGRFRFETDSGGAPLRTGDYMLIVSAEQYQTRETGLFSVGADQDLNVGSIALTSSPIRFTDMSACNVPSAGGWCEFSVKITNGLSTRLSGQAWSIVGGSGIGSFINMTNFQTDDPLLVSLDPGRSTILRFRFLVSGTVADGAFVCTSVFVGQGTHPYFNPVGQSNLFCFTKGSNGFTLISPQETQVMVQQMEVRTAPQPSAVINKQE